MLLQCSLNKLVCNLSGFILRFEGDKTILELTEK